MKIIHSGDWHIGNFKGPEKGGVNLRSLDTKRCLEYLAAQAEQERPDLVLVPGDIFHNGKTGGDRCCDEVVLAIRIITRLAAASGQVVVMRGTPNHDGEGPFKVLSEHFSGFSNVHIAAAPEVIQTEYADIAVLPGFDYGIYRAGFPGLSREQENEAFTRELSNIVLGLRARCRPDRKSILMAHYTVPGCSTEGSQTMLLAQFEPVIQPEALQAAGYDLAALGHIHRPQAVPGVDSCFYSGAINAINFNDEGQERGFWIHTDLPSGGWESRFCRTPAREFITLEFSDEDITAVNLGRIDEVACRRWRYDGAVQDRIVRIHYRCTADNARAYKMKEALVEKALLEDGAFMLWENLPAETEEAANRTELSGTADPEENLIRYLEEKEVPPDKVQELVLKARPIIAEAEAGMPSAAYAGIFEPVEISVRNYRNYENETFSFENITFCTINGPNGAGKSSLFMDAIIDCLYEEPREGEIVGWVRNDSRGCEGMIMFTFRIGARTYRVTRTRTRPKKEAKNRTGKGSLNLSELVGGGWENRSKDRFDDTQQEIIDIIGMDSFTFRSCALIMQDQYGLFLQAKPEERVEVLGTLLGLGVYRDMEKTAQDRAKASGAKARELNQKTQIHSSTLSGLGTPGEELAACRAELAGYEESLRAETAERDRSRLALMDRQAAAGRHRKLLAEISALKVKRASVEQSRGFQQAAFDSSRAVLDSREEVEAKAAEYYVQAEREKELAERSALYSAKKAEAENYRKQAAAEQAAADRIKAQTAQKEAELAALQPTGRDDAVRENAVEYWRQKKLLDEAHEKERAYREAEKRLSQAEYNLQKLSMQYEADIKRIQLGEDSLKKKAELLKNVDCVDISNAKCGFLADAVSARQQLEGYPGQYADRKRRYEEALCQVNEEIRAARKQMEETGYDSTAAERISRRALELKPYVEQLEALNQREGRKALAEAGLENLRANLLEAQKRLADAVSKAVMAEQERDQYADAFAGHAAAQEAAVRLKPWLEKEKDLAAAEERKAAAEARLQELDAELAEIDMEVSGRQEEADKEALEVSGMEALAEAVAGMDAAVEAAGAAVRKMQIRIGALQEKAEQAAGLKKEIAALQEKETEHAKEAADYEALKTAFSQNGVPHQIIRSIVPQLTASSNAILGQMTGGKMGVEFRLERMQKNREKASLDIFIDEYGKSVLPYLSKSGGEKVKASLSVILALAEIKSSSAGIQLGMLFIDEPPFLDADGVDAYCDALEAIQGRYRGIKIMAITHDPAMKARFPQNIDVVKTEQGSRVVY